MQKSIYKTIYLNEDSHFFYTSAHTLVINFLRIYFSNNKVKILDAGCGTGMMMKKLQQFGTVWGVDINPLALQFCHKRGLSNIKRANLNKLPFDNNFFDAIVSIDVLYHLKIRDDVLVLKELHRVLKPDGVLILKLPAFEWLSGNHDKVVHTRQRYTASEVRTKLISSGYSIEKISYINMFILPFIILKRSLDQINQSSPNSELSKLPNSINIILITIQKIENTLLKIINLPFGLSVFAIARK